MGPEKMTTTERLRGIFPPLVTPFEEESEEVDEEGLRAVVDFLVDNGVNGLFVLGSSGEFAYMNAVERERVAEVVLERAAGRVPSILNVSAPSVKVARGLIRHGLEAGYGAFVANLPAYFDVGAREVRRYYSKLKATCGDAPLLAYQFHEFVPSAVDLTPRLLARLANEGTIDGMKDSTMDWEGHAKPVLEGLRRRDEFCFLAGTEALLKKAAGAGAHLDGGVFSSANHFPRLCADLFRAVESGDSAVAGRLFELTDATGALYASVGVSRVPALAKEILHALGLPITTTVRSPLPGLSRTHEKRVEGLLEAVERAGYLDRF
ncbi:MAG: dihydrodipicolinate synthase family protein [Promethearchaeota archaeon]